MNDSSKGITGLVGVLIAAIALYAASHQSDARAQTLAQHPTEVASILTYLIGGIGVSLTYVSHPPRWLRAPLDRLKARIAGAATTPAPTTPASPLYHTPADADAMWDRIQTRLKQPPPPSGGAPS